MMEESAQKCSCVGQRKCQAVGRGRHFSAAFRRRAECASARVHAHLAHTSSFHRRRIKRASSRRRRSGALCVFRFRASAPLNTCYILIERSVTMCSLVRLRTLLFLPLALLARADYVLTSRFAASDCTGESVPLTVDGGACLQSGDSTWEKKVCASSSSVNTSVYNNAQCSGTPITTIPTSNSLSTCTYSDSFAAYAKGVCMMGSFDPVPPQPFISGDAYIVDRGSAGGATCPPTLGSGVQFYSRQYINTIKEKVTLNECALIDDGKASIFISCDPLYPQSSLLIQRFDNSPDCTGDATYVSAGCQNNSIKDPSTFTSKWPGNVMVSAVGESVIFDLVLFNNAGKLCLPPPAPAPAPAAAASLSTTSIVGIGAAVSLTTAALALAANYFFQRSLVHRRKPADAAPLLGAGVSMVAR